MRAPFAFWAYCNRRALLPSFVLLRRLSPTNDPDNLAMTSYGVGRRGAGGGFSILRNPNKYYLFRTTAQGAR
jgi:hypothetical protein